MKFLKAGVLSYDIMAPFIVPDFLGEYTLEVKDLWGDCDSSDVKLFNH